MTYPLGVHTPEQMSNDEYHNLKDVEGKLCISSTLIKTTYLKHTLAAFKGLPPSNQAILDVGSALHDLRGLAIMPIQGGKTRATKEFKEADKQAKKLGCIALPEADYKRVIDMNNAMLANKTMYKFFGKPKQMKEHSVFVKGPPLFNTISKAKVDLYLPKEKILIDYKVVFSGGADPYKFEKHIINMAYHVQAAWYSLTLEAAKMPVKRFLFFVVERDYPHPTSIVEVSKDLLNYGKDIVQETLPKIATAYETQKFTTGWPEIHTANLTDWM